MTYTVLLHRPISAEIRTVDSQSDLRILLYSVMIIRKNLIQLTEDNLHNPDNYDSISAQKARARRIGT